jgi:hypothetical protein
LVVVGSAIATAGNRRRCIQERFMLVRRSVSDATGTVGRGEWLDRQAIKVRMGLGWTAGWWTGAFLLCDQGVHFFGEGHLTTQKLFMVVGILVRARWIRKDMKRTTEKVSPAVCSQMTGIEDRDLKDWVLPVMRLNP